MRRYIKIPRILKINRIDGHKISVVFNNGESRIIDFKKVLISLKTSKDSPAYILFDPQEFKKVRINNSTLSWNNVKQQITLRNGIKVRVPFEIGPDVLLSFSESEEPDSSKSIGYLIRESRIKSGLTQQELAKRSGTTRNYISRIENSRSDIEIDTLRKIVETGLGKELQIVIK